MGFSQENGYTPLTFEALMLIVMNGVNSQNGTTYTAESFIGTNWYKFYYPLVQRLQQSEVTTSQIFLFLQQYFSITNERLSRPVTTSPGTIEKLLAEGYVASTKPIGDSDAGKRYICVDVDDAADDYATTKLDICTLISECTVGGVVTQGDQVEAIVASNGQSFDWKFSLPNRIPVGLRLTIVTSENNQTVIKTPEEVKAILLANILAKYKLGKNFEPQTYFSVVDAPWAASVLLEWTDDVTDGEIDETPTWHDEIYDAAFDDLFEFDLALISLVES